MKILHFIKKQIMIDDKKEINKNLKHTIVKQIILIIEKNKNYYDRHIMFGF